MIDIDTTAMGRFIDFGVARKKEGGIRKTRREIRHTKYEKRAHPAILQMQHPKTPFLVEAPNFRAP